MSEVIYTNKNSIGLGMFSSMRSLILNSIKYRSFVFALYRRDFLMNFRRSFFGVTWLVIAPAVGVLSWIFLNFIGILKTADTDVPYPIYVMIGSALWTLFLGCYSSVAETLKSGSGLLFQVKFPHELLFIIQLLQVISNFAISFLFNLVISACFGVAPTWRFLLLPFAILPILFFASGLGLIMALVSAVALDIRKVFDVFLGFGLFLTPVLYSKISAHETIKKYLNWNPLTHFFDACRDIIFNQHNLLVNYYWGFSITSIFVFFLGVHLFKSFESKVVEKLV